MTKGKMTDEEFSAKAKELLTEQQKTEQADADAKKPKSETDIAVDLAAQTLTGDIRDFLLDRVKALGKPWVAMTEDEQSDQIHAAKEAAERIVRKACEIIASGGKKAMIGTLESVTVKDGVKAVVKLSKTDEQRHNLIDAQGHAVSVIFADAQPFTGERAPAEPTPSQGSLLDKAEKLKESDDKVLALAESKK